MKGRLFVIASQRSIGKTWWIVGEKASPRSREVRQDVELPDQSRSHASDRNSRPLGRGPGPPAISFFERRLLLLIQPIDTSNSDSPTVMSNRHVVLNVFTKVSSTGLRPAALAGGSLRSPSSALPGAAVS